MYSVFNHFFDSESTETVIDKTQHARKRRVLSQALSDRALKTMENSVLLNVRRFCEHLLGGHPVKHSTVLADTKSGTEWSMAKNVAKWINYLSFDVMGDICFGESFDMMEREDNRYMMDVISDGSQGLHVVRSILCFVVILFKLTATLGWTYAWNSEVTAGSPVVRQIGPRLGSIQGL